MKKLFLISLLFVSITARAENKCEKAVNDLVTAATKYAVNLSDADFVIVTKTLQSDAHKGTFKVPFLYDERGAVYISCMMSNNDDANIRTIGATDQLAIDILLFEFSLRTYDLYTKTSDEKDAADSKKMAETLLKLIPLLKNTILTHDKQLQIAPSQMEQPFLGDELLKGIGE